MELYNNTDLPALAFHQYQAGTGQKMACIVVKATCDLHQGYPLVFSDNQEPILFEDKYFGEPHQTTMIAASDIVPFKPAADITVVTSYTPVLEHRRQAGLILDDMAFKMDILPEHHLRYTGQKWVDERSVENRDQPLSWEKAFGGVTSHAGQPPYDVVRANPIGCGAADLKHVPQETSHPLPTVVAPGALPSDTLPWGCAPMSPWWQSRQQYAGTYDANWLAEIHPRLPPDFDYRFYQIAPQPLVKEGYLAGGAKLRLINLLAEQPMFDSALPSWRPRVSAQYKTLEVEGVDMNFDGCHFTLNGNVCKAVLTWRQWLKNDKGIRAFKVDLDGLSFLLDDKHKTRKNAPEAPWTAWEADY